LSFFVSKQTGKTVLLPNDLDNSISVFFGDLNPDYKKILVNFAKIRGYKVSEDTSSLVFDIGDKVDKPFLSGGGSSYPSSSSNGSLMPPPPLVSNTDSSGSFNLIQNDRIIRSVPFGSSTPVLDSNCTYTSKQLHFVDRKDVVDLLDFSKLNYKVLGESSTIVFCTSSKQSSNLKSLLQLIDQVDRPSDQVVVRITVSEIDQTKLRDFGLTPNLTFDFSILSKAGALISGNAVGNFYSSLSFLQNHGVGKIGNSTDYFLTNGKIFHFADAQTLPFIDESYVVTAQPSTNQSKRYKFKDVGYTLEIDPKILGDQVQLDFDLKFENVLSNQDYLPVTTGKKIKTTFSAKKGDLIVLAGIKKDSSLSSTDEMPINIPILSDLFKRKKDNNSNTTLTISVEILN
jgi:general secretion pathway protein D